MNTLSEDTKQELINALNGKQSGFFVVDGKLVSVEVENNDSDNDLSQEDLSREMEVYPELRESLSRYLDNPGMKRYTGNELIAKRNEKNYKGYQVLFTEEFELCLDNIQRFFLNKGNKHCSGGNREKMKLLHTLKPTFLRIRL
ncbi:hypothetical protein [Radiobacillus sp. PE A8.2]|uniref:hypothetical protein n=1 Tax=Radiobacillus sp. PE A8.2 TaxID=3380349 RepID=UPI0038902344